ncbi:MAG: tRNA pseudouridine(13) synthase TruD [Candidatus Diapherotrites archaeon]|nr:tRNA pseudouridine(13) synthase TruD [Candidatus Diapherotrites archaeon]
MQFKFLSEDFKVTELIDFKSSGKGNYFYYWLTKKNLSNSEIEKIFREKGLKVFSSGIKDKKAITKQLVCVEEKIPELKEENFSLEFAGQAEKKLNIGSHKANSFEIVLRDIPGEKILLLKKLLKNVKKQDFPNYFDEQRFGSKDVAQKLGRSFLEQKHEQALQIFLTSGSGKFSELVENSWGNWKKILHEIPVGFRKREVFEFLQKNPKNFEGAFKFVERGLLKRFLRQFQSFEFNAELREQIEKNNSKQKFVEILSEKFPVIVSKKSVKRFLSVSGFSEFSVPVLKRQSCFNVQDLKFSSFSEDEFFPGRKKMLVSFVLGKGVYATIFLKCLDYFLD